MIARPNLDQVGGNTILSPASFVTVLAVVSEKLRCVTRPLVELNGCGQCRSIIGARMADCRGMPFFGLRSGGWERMEKYPDELKLLVELDERHDKLLQELDDLDKRIETVLAVWLAEREVRGEAA